MPQAIQKKVITINYGGAGAVDYSSQIEAPSIADAKTMLDIMTVDKLRITSIPGLSKGTYNFTAVPTTIGGTFVTLHNTDHTAGALITIVDQQITGAASTSNIHWTITGYVDAPMGYPVSQGDAKKYPVKVSIATLTYDIGGGAVTVE